MFTTSQKRWRIRCYLSDILIGKTIPTFKCIYTPQGSLIIFFCFIELGEITGKLARLLSCVIFKTSIFNPLNWVHFDLRSKCGVQILISLSKQNCLLTYFCLLWFCCCCCCCCFLQKKESLFYTIHPMKNHPYHFQRHSRYVFCGLLIVWTAPWQAFQSSKDFWVEHLTLVSLIEIELNN